MAKESQEIIAAAIETRDSLSRSEILRIPYFEERAAFPSLTGFSKGPTLDAEGNWLEVGKGSYGLDPLYEQRRHAAKELARLLDPSQPADWLVCEAADIRDRAWGKLISFSPKVFIDLTRLCRDRCAYCAFVRHPLSVASSGRNMRRVQPMSSCKQDSAVTLPLRAVGPKSDPYLLPEEVLSIAEAGKKAGCKEALFTLGDRPEERYPSARAFLQRMGYDSTAHYLYECARLVVKEIGLLPHLNPGVMTKEELRSYKEVAASCGMMLESTSYRLFAHPSGCHYGCPDKEPSVRISCIEEAGTERIPFTTGVLVGIGESLEARADTLLVLASLARKEVHIQEVIVQNFKAKPSIPMRGCPEPTPDEMRRVVALARLLLPERVAVQAPPNLSPATYASLIEAGLSDWGGVSPVTLDYVNPEAAWPEVRELAHETIKRGFELRARLCVYPSFVVEPGWVSESVKPYVDAAADSQGWALLDEPLASELRNASELFRRECAVSSVLDQRG